MIESYPLYWPDGWKRSKYRSSSAFKVGGFGRARDLLLAEVRRLGGTKVILSTNVPLRQDGLPYANSREPDDPGVAVYFNYKKQDMCFACDCYSKLWENTYAIAKTIEAIRAIERWGASDMMERAFKGFAALPENASTPWRDVLGIAVYPVTEDQIESKFRELAKVHHPDVGGDAAQFRRIIDARNQALQEITA